MQAIVLLTPWVAFLSGAALLLKALHLVPLHRSAAIFARYRVLASLAGALALQSMARAAADLQTAVESGNAIIMYLSGVLAAVGIICAGVAMMMGRQQIAKWAFAGSMISGLGFAIVKTMWSNFGLTAADVSTFTP